MRERMQTQQWRNNTNMAMSKTTYKIFRKKCWKFTQKNYNGKLDHPQSKKSVRKVYQLLNKEIVNFFKFYKPLAIDCLKL